MLEFMNSQHYFQPLGLSPFNPLVLPSAPSSCRASSFPFSSSSHPAGSQTHISGPSTVSPEYSLHEGLSFVKPLPFLILPLPESHLEIRRNRPQNSLQPQRNGNSGSWGAEGKWVQPPESHIHSSNWPIEAHSESEQGSVGSILDAWVSPTFQTPAPVMEKKPRQKV